MRQSLMMVLSAFLLWAPAAPAAELIMFEKEWCEWCERWREEIGPIYPNTAEGRRAPLRRIDIDATPLPGVELASWPRYTPTFVLVEDGREVGRIEGYPGEDFFWGLLTRLLERIGPAPEAVPRS